MDDERLLTIDELAEFMRTTNANIYNQLSKGNEGITVPPSIKIGRRRLWLESTMLDWLKQIQEKTMSTVCNPQAALKRPTIKRI